MHLSPFPFNKEQLFSKWYYRAKRVIIFRFSIAIENLDYYVTFPQFSLLTQICVETQWGSETRPLQATFG